MIRFYCGVNETSWNRHPVRPGRYACIAPSYGRSEATRRTNRVAVPLETMVIQDSGAFSDSRTNRLDFAAALDRQMNHADTFGYASQVTHRASYDLLIDEKWQDGIRRKSRWTELEADTAVQETINAARFMATNYSGARIQSAQGVSPHQYERCTKDILEWFDLDRDIFGLGGWCVSGIMPLVMRPVFNATMLRVISLLGQEKVRRVHIWGVSDVTFLGPLLWLCDRHGISLSTDSSAPQRRPTQGVWGFRGWYKEYPAPSVEYRGIHRMMLVKLFRCRLNSLRDSDFYHHPNLPDGKTLFSTQRQMV